MIDEETIHLKKYTTQKVINGKRLSELLAPKLSERQLTLADISRDL